MTFEEKTAGLKEHAEFAAYMNKVKAEAVGTEYHGAVEHELTRSTQFLFDARDEFGLDLAQSHLIGDKLIDLECGWNAGLKSSILVRTGYGAELESKSPEKIGRAWVADDLAAAAERILKS